MLIKKKSAKGGSQPKADQPLAGAKISGGKKEKISLPNDDELEIREIKGEGEKGIFREKSTFQVIFLATAVILLFLPFITTFNEFLTKIVERFQFYTVIEDVIVPYLSRLVGVMLLPFGYEVAGTPEGLFLAQKNLNIQIAWNCVGWQSMILIIITLITGLQGRYTKFSKGQAVLIGLLGTFLFNVLRITSVVLFAVYFGYFPAVIYHDYFSNLLIILWLFFFWWFSYAFVLDIAPPRNGERIAKTGKKRRFGLSLPLKVVEIRKKLSISRLWANKANQEVSRGGKKTINQRKSDLKKNI
ncbi:MAG: exosortase/archaeosortase family protein [Patescibacteria group bacterium]